MFGKSNYSLDKNTVEGVKFTCIIIKVYFVLVVVGMQLRVTPSNREGKDRLRQERRTVKIRNEHN